VFGNVLKPGVTVVAWCNQHLGLSAFKLAAFFPVIDHPVGLPWRATVNDTATRTTAIIVFFIGCHFNERFAQHVHQLPCLVMQTTPSGNIARVMQSDGFFKFFLDLYSA